MQDLNVYYIYTIIPVAGGGVDPTPWKLISTIKVDIMWLSKY